MKYTKITALTLIVLLVSTILGIILGALGYTYISKWILNILSSIVIVAGLVTLCWAIIKLWKDEI